jgi:hypothetical protein
MNKAKRPRYTFSTERESNRHVTDSRFAVDFQQSFLFLAKTVAAGMLATAAIKWFRVKR